jgi:anaerobic selenocysteine-containing dehydrogenase
VKPHSVPRRLSRTLSAERITSIRGDRNHPLSRGYTCSKGLLAPEAYHDDSRLLHPLKRRPDGTFEEITLSQALDEIAERLGEIIDRYGGEAIAGYRGTANVYSAAASQMLPDWLHSLGSNAYYTTMSIDQSAKWVTFERLGAWAAGRQRIDDADVLLLAGTNPLVSLGAPGFAHHPVNTLRKAKDRGMRLVVIDPRRGETARYADLHLQPLPGHDAALAAALLHVILEEGWHDSVFCEQFVDGLDALRAAVSPFSPSAVGAAAGLPPAEIAEAARIFARPLGGKLPRGYAHAGTGVTMSPHGNLADHLYECLNVVCGRYLRPGEPIGNPGLFMPPEMPIMAGVIPPQRSFETGFKSRIGGYGMLFGERMTAELADEILTSGAGQIKSLFISGGNPASVIADQHTVVQALEHLELLVTIDPNLTTTARLSHYVLPPTLPYERADLLAAKLYETALFARPVAQYTPAVIAPPAGSEIIDDPLVFWELARRLGIALTFDGTALDMSEPPTMDDLNAALLRHGRVDFETVRAHRGEILDIGPRTVGGPVPGGGRFAVAPDDVIAEIAAVSTKTASQAVAVLASPYTHLLVPRRMREVSNTMYRHLPTVRHRVPYNPAWVHPADLDTLGLTDGDCVYVVSEHGQIRASVRADATMRRAVIAMSHGWGELPREDTAYERVGSCISMLISSRDDLEPINAMPRQSAIPVRLEPAEPR